MSTAVAMPILAFSVVACGASAVAQDPKPLAPAAAPAAAAPRAQARGVVVIALGDAAGPAARALAMDVYRDPLLRPAIDEAAARVLAGDMPPAGAPATLKEIADVRASVARAESDLVIRRLLASIGTDLGAPLVVTVAIDGGRPVARALRSSGAGLERVELGATIETGSNGAKTYRWPGATHTLRGILGVSEPAPPPDPLRPVAQTAPVPPAPVDRPFYKSPWFWGTAGVVAAAGITVLVLSRTTAGPGEAHITGKVGP